MCLNAGNDDGASLDYWRPLVLPRLDLLLCAPLGPARPDPTQSTVTMENSLFLVLILLFLSSFTLVTLGRMQSRSDDQILVVPSDGQQPPPPPAFTLLQTQDKARNQPIRHFWHWIQAQTQQQQEKTADDNDQREEEVNKRRRRKEVANGEEGGRHQQHLKDMSEIVHLHKNSTLSAAGGHNQTHESHGIHVASWRWEEVGVLFTFTSFIVVAGLAKVGKPSSWYHFFSSPSHIMSTMNM